MIRYPAFGISIPTQYAIHGIDVSKYQQRIDWQDVKSMRVSDIQIQFSFIKATEGLDDVDRQFRRNWAEAAAAGVHRGAYHYFYPHRSPKIQAEHFLETVPLDAGDLPPVLDVEETFGLTKPVLQQRVAEWLKQVQDRLQIKPILYTNADFYEKYLAGRFDSFPLWVAHYQVRDQPRVKRNWQFWQHSETGRVNGIDAPVDFNAFSGDSAAFQQLLLRKIPAAVSQ